MNLHQFLIKNGLTQQYWKQTDLQVQEILCLTILESMNVCQAVEKIIVDEKNSGVRVVVK